MQIHLPRPEGPRVVYSGSLGVRWPLPQPLGLPLPLVKGSNQGVFGLTGASGGVAPISSAKATRSRAPAVSRATTMSVLLG